MRNAHMKYTKQCFILIGFPATGKSSWIENNVDESNPNVHVASFDRYFDARSKSENKTYDEVQRDNFKEGALNYRMELSIAIKANKTIYFDRTFLGDNARGTHINRMHCNHYHVTGIVFPYPTGPKLSYDEWQYRLQNRPGKTIKEYDLRQMGLMYIEPNMTEGFDRLVFLDNGEHI